jgi:hypothetical protein
VVRVWDIRTGIALATRPFGENDPGLMRSGSAEAIDAARRRLDDSGDTLPWALEPRGGALVAVDRRTGTALAWMPASEDLCQHPSEPVWAGGPVHVRLEQVK